MTTTRAQRAAALEVWADTVEEDDLVVANTEGESESEMGSKSLVE